MHLFYWSVHSLEVNFISIEKEGSKCERVPMCTPYKLEKVENRGTPYKREGREYILLHVKSLEHILPPFLNNVRLGQAN
jgi:hypothetical protein